METPPKQDIPAACLATKGAWLEAIKDAISYLDAPFQPGDVAFVLKNRYAANQKDFTEAYTDVGFDVSVLATRTVEWLLHMNGLHLIVQDEVDAMEARKAAEGDGVVQAAGLSLVPPAEA